MQGLKPQQVQNEDKSKAITNLMETAKTMLKNGAPLPAMLSLRPKAVEVTHDLFIPFQDRSFPRRLSENVVIRSTPFDSTLTVVFLISAQHLG